MGYGPWFEKTKYGELPENFGFITSLENEADRWIVLQAVVASIVQEQGLVMVQCGDEIEWHEAKAWDRMVFGRLPDGQIYEFRLVKQRESMSDAQHFRHWHKIEDIPQPHDYIEYEARIYPLPAG